MALYSMMTPYVSGVITPMTLTANTAKTIAELGTSANVPIKIVEWSVTFNGVTATNTPVLIEFAKASAAVTTATSYTPVAVDATGGTAATTTKHNTTTEGAGTLSSGLGIFVPPTSGLIVQYPLGREWVVPVSSYWRIRGTAPQTITSGVCFHITWEE